MPEPNAGPRVGRTKPRPAKPKKPRAAPTPKTRTKAKAAKKRAPAKKKHDWKPAWLKAFRELGMVTAACRATNVGRQTVYEARKDETFAAAWDEIEQESTEAMEREAYRRGMEGVVEPVVSGGKHVTDVTKYSDTLLIFLLKARKPATYRENVKIEHSGKVKGGRTDVIVIPDDGTRRSEVLALLAGAGVGRRR